MNNFWQKLKKPITVLAPMEDVTDFVFREIIAEIGKPDVMFTEFTSVDALCSRGRDKALKKFNYSDKQRTIVAQVWGSDPIKFGVAAKDVANLAFDGIDVNMGCPDKKVIKNGCGAALINQYDKAHEIISSIKQTCPKIPLSIKTRLSKNETLTQDWFHFLLEQDIQAITLHAREAKVMSKNHADWNKIKMLVEMRDAINPNITIIGNGDIIEPREIITKHKEYGVDGVMVARGIFQNPWFFANNEDPHTYTIQQKINLLLKHTKLFVDTWGNTKNFETMKKFFKIYIKGFNGAEELRTQLMKAKNYEDVIELTKNAIA